MNAQTKHTPGPWKTLSDEHGHKNGNPFGSVRFIATEDANFSGDSPASDDYLTSGSLICVMRDGPKANARLIAAAPELLAALEKISSNAAESPEWIRRIAQEAISKAEGNA